MNTLPIITSGHALAQFAREIAADARAASGDLMDGANAEALAAAWDEAIAALDAHTDPTITLANTLGWMHGAEHGQDQRDRLLELARTLRAGFGAALALAADPDELDLTEEEQESLGATQLLIAAADGACAALAELESEAAI